MAQTSLTPTRKRTFDDPEKARAAVNGRKDKGRGPEEEFTNLRRQQVIEMRVRGRSTAEIAEYFNVSEATIRRDITTIRRNGLVEKYEAKFLGKLMPLAMQKIAKQLQKDDDNLEGVKEVFKRFDKLSEQKHQKELAEGSQKEETLSGWYEQWLAQKQAEANAPPPDAVDTEIVEETSENHETKSQAGVDAGGDAGSGDATRQSAEALAPPASLDTSQGGLEASPESREGSGGNTAGDTRPRV